MTEQERSLLINVPSCCQNLAPLSVIDHKYMEPGHSQMEFDNVHAAVETAWKKGLATTQMVTGKSKP